MSNEPDIYIERELTLHSFGLVGATFPVSCPATTSALFSFQELFLRFSVFARWLRVAGARNERLLCVGTGNEPLLCCPFSVCDTAGISRQPQSRRGTLYVYMYMCLYVIRVGHVHTCASVCIYKRVWLHGYVMMSDCRIEF